MQLLKGILAGIAAYLATIICPIENYLKVIIFLAVVNIIFGRIADIEGWSFKKAFHAIVYLLIYMTLLCVTMVVGKMMNHQDIQMTEVTSYITWVMIYFYSVNILRNMHLRWPKDKTIFFLYWVISFKIVDNIKFMKEFKETVDKKEEEK